MMSSATPGYVRLLYLRQQRDRRRLVWLALLLLAALILSLSAGEIWLWPDRWLSPGARLYIWQLRLPRALAVLAVGASLAMAGAVMQGIFDNPLAEPGLLGVANSAGVALTLAVLLGGGRMPVWGLGPVRGGGGAVDYFCIAVVRAPSGHQCPAAAHRRSAGHRLQRYHDLGDVFQHQP